MDFENDYIMRMIHECVRMLLKLVFQVDTEPSENINVPVEIEEQYKRLTLMIDDGNINEAEDSLIEELNDKNLKDFQLALLFYEYLNQKNDDFLEKHNYTRKEISDGIKYVVEKFGYGGMEEAFLEDLE